MTVVRVGGRRISCRVLGHETLTLDSFASGDKQDCTAAVWDWFARYQIPTGNLLGFSSRRDRRFGTKWTLKDAATTAMSDDAIIRIVEYYPDQKRMKRILLEETYGTLKNASRDDIQKLITPNEEAVIPEGNWLRFECYHATETLDVSECTIEVGTLRMQRL